MNDAFGKITGFLLAAILLFIVPVSFYANRQRNLIQLHIINKSIQFIETVENTGIITKDMYYGLEDSVLVMGGRYVIELEKSNPIYNMDEEGVYVKTEEKYYTAQLLEELESADCIYFEEGDYIYLRITKIEKSVLDMLGDFFVGNMSDDETIAFYGGYIKNESY